VSGLSSCATGSASWPKFANPCRAYKLFLDTNPAWCENQHHILPALGKDELARWSTRFITPIQPIVPGGLLALHSFSNFIGKLRRELLNIVSPDATIALLSM